VQARGLRGRTVVARSRRILATVVVARLRVQRPAATRRVHPKTRTADRRLLQHRVRPDQLLSQRPIVVRLGVPVAVAQIPLSATGGRASAIRRQLHVAQGLRKGRGTPRARGLSGVPAEADRRGTGERGAKRRVRAVLHGGYTEEPAERTGRESVRGRRHQFAVGRQTGSAVRLRRKKEEETDDRVDYDQDGGR